MSSALTNEEVASVARPGESWASARQRVERLRRSVRLCWPCHECDIETYVRLGIAPGWVDENRFCCPSCSYEKDNESFFELEELQRDVALETSMLTWQASL
ncbi:hypothetical protein D3C76_1629120 [compost metagenome]